jgi:D12 class N6 adenine-specific DNA methyltransferase
MPARLKAPFPYFGGKGRVAKLVWQRLGKVRNFIEPFAGSASVLLARPDAPVIETLNDTNSFISNFWRAVQADPDKVAYYADWPVSEIDLHSRHLWMLCSETSEDFRLQMRSEPEFYDAKIAGWWVWGQSCWIGSGWCDEARTIDGPDEKRVGLSMGNSEHGRGVHAKARQVKSGNRPQLADAFSRGRGVNSNDLAGSVKDRQVWLRDWMRRLADRLRTVRVCCGSWERVCSSESVTTRLGLTGIFMDPPYAHDRDRLKAWIDHLDGNGEPPLKGTATNRAGNIYSGETRKDIDRLAAQVHRYCREMGANPMIRIVLAGYAGEHDALEDHGWQALRWRGSGYNNRTAEGKANANRETLWYSPHCYDPDVEDRPLFKLLKRA